MSKIALLNIIDSQISLLAGVPIARVRMVLYKDGCRQNLSESRHQI